MESYSSDWRAGLVFTTQQETLTGSGICECFHHTSDARLTYSPARPVKDASQGGVMRDVGTCLLQSHGLLPAWAWGQLSGLQLTAWLTGRVPGGSPALSRQVSG